VRGRKKKGAKLEREGKPKIGWELLRAMFHRPSGPTHGFPS